MGLFKKSKPVESCSCKNTENSLTNRNQSVEEFSADEQSAGCQDGCCSCLGNCADGTESGASDTGASGMSIKILGSGCKNCIMLYENVHTALKELGLQAKVVKITDFAEISGYGVMSTPAMVINEKVVSYGKVLKPAEVKNLLSYRRQDG